MRKCKTCGQVKVLDEFYIIDKEKGRRRSVCKECKRKYQSEHNRRPEVRKRIRAYWQEYLERPGVKERLIEYSREYNRKPEVRKRKSDYSKEWRSEKKRKAYYAIRKAVESGELNAASTLTCVDCGRQAEQYFYENYTIPPDVTAVCVSCHRQRVFSADQK